MFSGPVERHELCEFSSIISDLSTGGDIWSEHDNIPFSDDRRMFNGSVVVGGGIMPASRSFFGSFNWLAHSISAEHAVDPFAVTGDDDDDDDESSFV